MPLSAPQKEIASSKARFRVAVCGRRFGKTFEARHEIGKYARNPDSEVWYLAPTYRMAKQIMWSPLLRKLQELRWVEESNKSDLTITLRNGSKISLKGTDNKDSLRGTGLNAVILDEFSYMEEEVWTEVVRPMLSDKEGHALFITTPNGTANWSYDLYNRGLDPYEDAWESFSFTTLQGGNVSAEEIEQARRDLDTRTFQQEYMATFENYTNRIFYAFERTRNLKEYNAPLPPVICIGMDFNVGQMSAAVYAKNGNVIHQFDEISLLSSNTDELVQEIRNRYPTQQIIVYPDPAGAARKSSASGRTDHSILKNAGFLVKAPLAHNPVRDGINAVNSKLFSSTGQVTYCIDPKCKKSIESLEKHSYKENSSVPDKDSGFDHFSDAIRYFIDYEYPIKRIITPTKPQRFGHSIA